MSFLHDVGAGLSFVGGFVPGAQGLAVAGKLALMVGKPDALVPNPAREHPYAPRGVLWGIPRTEGELRGWTMGGDVDLQLHAALNKEAVRRGGFARVNGHVVRVPAMSWRWRRVRAKGGDSPAGAMFLRLDQYNLVVKAWLARIEAHATKDPIFDYIDTRVWSEVAEGLFWDYLGENQDPEYEAASKLHSVNGKKFWLGPKDLAGWIARKNPAAEEAFATWSAFHAGELARYDLERQAWREWKAEVADELERQRQVELLEQQFNQVWASNPNKGEAAQLMQGIAAQVASSAKGPPAVFGGAVSAAGGTATAGGAEAPSTGPLLLLGLVGLIALVALGDG